MNVPLVKFLKGLPKQKLQQVVIVSVGSLIALVLACQFYLGKQISSTLHSRRQIVELKHQIEDAEQAAREASKKEGDRQALVAFVEQQRGLMVSGDPFSWLVREISLLAEKHPVHISGLHPGAMSPHPRNTHFSVYSATIELAGGYDEVGNFVRDIENTFPTGEIRSVELAGASDSGGGLHVTLKLALLVRPQRDTAKVADKAKAEGRGA